MNSHCGDGPCVCPEIGWLRAPRGDAERYLRAKSWQMASASACISSTSPALRLGPVQALDGAMTLAGNGQQNFGCEPGPNWISVAAVALQHEQAGRQLWMNYFLIGAAFFLLLGVSSVSLLPAASSPRQPQKVAGGFYRELVRQCRRRCSGCWLPSGFRRRLAMLLRGFPTGRPLLSLFASFPARLMASFLPGEVGTASIKLSEQAVKVPSREHSGPSTTKYLRPRTRGQGRVRTLEIVTSLPMRIAI